MTSLSLQDKSNDESVRAIRKVVRTVLKDRSVEVVDIRLDEDDDGDISIIVVLRYDSHENVTGSLLNDLTYLARKKLVEIGDIRYPFFDHRFSDESFVS